MSIEKRRFIHKMASHEHVQEAWDEARKSGVDPMQASPLPRPGLKEAAVRTETISSLYSPSGTMTIDVPGVLLRGPNGEFLHEIERQKYPQTQYAISLMLKGIVPVTDIHVEKWPVNSLTPFITETKYYSFYRQSDMDRVEHKHSFAEIEADIFILRTVFGDDDHSLEPVLEMGYGGYPVQIKNHIINMYVSDDYSRVYFFDFHVSHFNVLPKIEIQDLFKNGESRETIRIYIEKLILLKERFGGEEGKEHMRAIFDKVLEGKTNRNFKKLFQGFDTLDSFYRVFIQHLETMVSAVNAWKHEHPELLKDKTLVEELFDVRRQRLVDIRRQTASENDKGTTDR